ncbi:MAG: Adaptive-response sensory-kinase SasA [Candidatus Methanoperedenaceae archaeon GB50]|nr:MAG: Adaptive-response sensory-kinase SasA [Candidatus Methanoperedenaceae archaeon GB50]
MILQGLSAYITALLSILLGTIVYFKNRERRLNQTCCLLNICVAIWSFFYGIMVTTSNQTLALFSARILNYGAMFIPIFYLHFIFCLLGQEKCRKTFINTAYILAIFLLAVTVSFPKYFVPSVSPKFSFRYYTNPGFLFYIYMAFWMFYVTYPFIILYTSIKKHSGLIQNQLKYVMIASIMGFTAGATTFLGVYSDKIYPFGMPFIFLYLLVITYAIVKYQLMDINIVIKKGTVYTYLSFLILLPCMVFIIFAQRFFFGKINYVFSSLVFVVLLLSAIVFSKTKFKAERFIERTLFKRKYEHKKTLTKLSKIVISFLDEKELFKKTSNIFIQDLEIESISFFLLDRRKGAYILRAFRELTPKIKKLPKDDIFFKWLKEDGQIIVKEELERFINAPKNKLIVERLNSMESEVCIPLITRGKLIGLINLGKKRSGDMYSHEDLELLANFANQAAVALENARLYEDMKKTQLLMRRTDRLAALGSLTAGLAHEIRNPLVAVNTFLQLLPERFEDKEFREEFLKLTTSEVERVTNLVNNLLDFARPSEPKLNKTDVNEIIEKVIALIRVTAKKKRVIINTKLEKIPQVMLDEEQIKQVFLNILLNAIEAIPNEGTIWVGSRSMQKNGLEYVQVEIEDTGKGIPKRILDHIFDPFFTTKEKGSGLGLSISHQIVQEHNGFIEVKSILGKGTTFFVNLPCRK